MCFTELNVLQKLDEYRTLNPANADVVYRARSLLYRVDKFVRAFEAKAIERYGPAIAFEGQARPSFELFSDGSRARILVFFKSSPSYSGVFKELFGPKETENLANSCGDVVLLDLSGRLDDSEFEAKTFPHYQSKRKGGILIDTEIDEHNQRRGITAIHRTGGEIKYRVHLSRNTDNLCVSVTDVLGRLRLLKKIQEDEKKPDVKIDYSRPPPDYLR